MSRIILKTLLVVSLVGCTTTGMSPQDQSIVNTHYGFSRRYANAIVYSVDPIPSSFAFGVRGLGIELPASAVWSPTEKTLVRYSNLTYYWDQARGGIVVWEDRSARME